MQFARAEAFEISMVLASVILVGGIVFDEWPDRRRVVDRPRYHAPEGARGDDP